jgi:hypothetical protein
MPLSRVTAEAYARRQENLEEAHMQPSRTFQSKRARRGAGLVVAFVLVAGLVVAAPALTLGINGGACNRDYSPAITPADFETSTGAPNPIDNAYFPLAPGTTWVYDGYKEGATLEDVMTVTPDTRTLMGVTVRVVRDTAYEDGILVEDTFDWYAQDDAGNVWYFGEDTREYDAQGNVTSTEGSWEAGANGSLPGILMEAAPASGDTYRQEYGLGIAVDMSTVLSLGKHLTVPLDTYANVIETKEYSCLESGLDHKFYAPGVGLVTELAVANGNEEIHLVSETP